MSTNSETGIAGEEAPTRLRAHLSGINYITREAPWWVIHTVTHPRGTLVGYTHLYTPERHHGGYYSLLHTREAPWWVLYTLTHPRGTLVGIIPLLTHPRGTLVGIQPLLHTRETPWWVYSLPGVYNRCTCRVCLPWCITGCTCRVCLPWWVGWCICRVCLPWWVGRPRPGLWEALGSLLTIIPGYERLSGACYSLLFPVRRA